MQIFQLTFVCQFQALLKSFAILVLQVWIALLRTTLLVEVVEAGTSGANQQWM